MQAAGTGVVNTLSDWRRISWIQVSWWWITFDLAEFDMGGCFPCVGPSNKNGSRNIHDEAGSGCKEAAKKDLASVSDHQLITSLGIKCLGCNFSISYFSEVRLTNGNKL
ncbi:unnamed protein product [Linum tenue]|nr:unnamed protein product [Linum tenue]CAI0625565.1 unnamed protein product [Linum tenue]CAI0625566.1 unnamed protein product [Linum tenue]